MNTTDKLNSGLATFTLSGKGRAWTYRLERVADERGTITFAKILVNGRWCYLGVYDSEHQYVRLTSASRFDAKSVAYRALSWYLGRVWASGEAQVAADGFTVTFVGEEPAQKQQAPAPVVEQPAPAKVKLQQQQIDAFYRAINRKVSTVAQKRKHRIYDKLAAGNAFTGTVDVQRAGDVRRQPKFQLSLLGAGSGNRRRRRSNLDNAGRFGSLAV